MHVLTIKNLLSRRRSIPSRLSSGQGRSRSTTESTWICAFRTTDAAPPIHSCRCSTPGSREVHLFRSMTVPSPSIAVVRGTPAPHTQTHVRGHRGGEAGDRGRLRCLCDRGTARLCGRPRRSPGVGVEDLHPRQPAAHQHHPLGPGWLARLRVQRPAVARRDHRGDVRARRYRVPADTAIARASRPSGSAWMVCHPQSGFLAHSDSHRDRGRAGSGHRCSHRPRCSRLLFHLGVGAASSCPDQAAGPHVLDRPVTSRCASRGTGPRSILGRAGMDGIGAPVARTRRRCHRRRGVRRFSTASQSAHSVATRGSGLGPPRRGPDSHAGAVGIPSPDSADRCRTRTRSLQHSRLLPVQPVSAVRVRRPGRGRFRSPRMGLRAPRPAGSQPGHQSPGRSPGQCVNSTESDSGSFLQWRYLPAVDPYVAHYPRRFALFLSSHSQVRTPAPRSRPHRARAAPARSGPPWTCAWHRPHSPRCPAAGPAGCAPGSIP